MVAPPNSLKPRLTRESESADRGNLRKGVDRSIDQSKRRTEVPLLPPFALLITLLIVSALISPAGGPAAAEMAEMSAAHLRFLVCS